MLYFVIYKIHILFYTITKNTGTLKDSFAICYIYDLARNRGTGQFFINLKKYFCCILFIYEYTKTLSSDKHNEIS